MLHIVKSPDNLERLCVGARVKAKWKSERTGIITDIDEFDVAWVPEEATR